MKKNGLFSLLVVILFLIIASNWQGRVFAMELIGHRGASDEAPENTKESIELAFKQGAKGAECDVHLTRDGRVVIIHDANLKRTTGLDKRVQDIDYNELKKLDAGSWMGQEWSGKDVRIPLLEEVIAIVPSDRIFFVELKEENPRLPEAVAKVVEGSLKKSQGRLTAQNIVFISFDLDYIDRIKKLLPQHKAYYLTDYSTGDKRVRNRAELAPIIERAKKNRVDGIDLEFGPMVDKELVGDLQKNGLSHAIWVMKEDDTKENILKCKEAGIDFFTTNAPEKMKTLI